MGVWESGPGMIEEPELEEGEACYYKDDPSMDPDIALSYIGDKVQSILGHFQKDFEGGVSAENLGSKFGGYGSFLPMYQRSPSSLSQPKSPQRVQNPSFSRSPKHPFPECPGINTVMVSDAPPSQRNGSASLPSMRPSRTLKFSPEDASMKQNESLCYDQVAQTFVGKVELPSNKSGNLTDHRTLKVRIKVGSERMAPYKEAIYNLGLTSPPSSAGNSPDETPNESPASILQIMTSFPVSSSLLLSPLCEDLMNLVKETESSIESEHEVARKSSAVSVKLLNNEVSRGKKTASVNNSEIFEKLNNGCLVDLNDSKLKDSESETLKSRVQPSHDLYCKPLSDTVREEKDVQVKERKGSKDKVKGRVVSGHLAEDTSFEHSSPRSCGNYEQQRSRSTSVENYGEYQTRISLEDVSVYPGHSSKSLGKKDHASYEAYLGIYEGESIKAAMDNSSLKVGTKATSSERYELGITDAGNKLSFKGKKKSNGRQSSGNFASKFEDSLIGCGSAAPKNKYGGKDVHSRHPSQRDVVDTGLEQLDDPKCLLERPSCDGPKNYTLQAAKAKFAYDDRLNERSSNKKHLEKMTSDIYSMEPPAAALPSTEGIIPGLEQSVVAPVVIQEDWVGCDCCQKWRLLPYGTKSEQLPDKWVCSMLDWLPGMNCCDISEDETTSAVRASYLVPVPGNQCNFQAPADNSIPGVSSAGVHHLHQSHQNFASDQISDQVRKQKRKEKLNAVSRSIAGPLSDGKKNLQRLAVKNGSSNKVNQSVAGVYAANKSIVQHPDKSSFVVAKLNKQKEGHVIGDDANPRKKRKKEPVQCVQEGRMEKIKPKGTLNADNCQISDKNLGGAGHSLTSGFPNKPAVKDGKKQSARKDAIPGGMGNMQINAKKQKDRVQDLLDDERMVVNTCNGREVSANKRKFGACEDSHHEVETQPDSGSNLLGRKVIMKEESKHSAFKRDKRSRVTEIEGEFNRSKGDDTSKQKGAEASVPLLGSKEYPINRGIEKEQQLRKPIAKARLTIEDIDKLRKDLGCEQLSTAAASSSSKVSDSCKNKISYMEVKGSPEESVSSSPARTTYPNKASPMTVEAVGKVDSRLNDVPAMGSANKFLDMNRSSELLITRKKKVSGVYCSEPFESPFLDFREGDAREKSSGEQVSGVNLPSDFVHSPLVGNEDNVLEQHSPCPTRIRVVNRGHNKEKMRKDLSNTKNSSLRSMGKNITSGCDFERVAENPSTYLEVHNSKNKLKEVTDVNDNYCAPEQEVLNKVRCPLSDESSIISVSNNMSVGNRDPGKQGDNRSENHSTRTERVRNNVKSSALCSADVIQQNLNKEFVGNLLEQTSTQMAPRSAKLCINLRQGDEQGPLCSSKHASGSSVSMKRSSMNSKPLDNSLAGRTSKTLKDAASACHPNGTDSLNRHYEAERSVAVDESLANKKVPSATPSTALKEAEGVLKEANELRIHADLIKNSGFGSESNYEYFKAAIEFLHGASLLEACNGGSSKHLEMNPMQIYGTAANLCKTCAFEYEKGHEMAAAALAYKCMEVAHLRVVYCKSSTMSRVCQDLQPSLRMVPQGESPSSSVSDVDNVNNSATADRATSSKGNGSHHVVGPCNRPNFVRLLDFTKDVSSAMEAAKKSHDMLASAHAKLEESQNKEGIVSVKRVIDFSFQDVDEFIRLAWVAFNTIFCQGLSGNRE